MQKIAIRLFPILLLITTACEKPVEPVNLSANYPENVRLEYVMQYDTKMQADDGGTALTSMQFDQQYALTYDSFSEDDTQSVVMEYLDLSMNMESGNKKLKLSTKDLAVDFLNQKIALKINRQHEILSVAGIEELRKKITEGNPAAAQMAGMLNNESLISSFQTMSGGSYPNKEIYKGYQWTESQKMKMPMFDMNINVALQYNGFERKENRKCARIDLTGEVIMENTTPKNSPLLIKNSSLKGTRWIEADTGILIDSITTQEFKIQLTDSKGSKTDQTITQVITQKLKQANPDSKTMNGE